jgi:CheY-like chemotaxis protein
VLLVDDNVDAADATAQLLRFCGHEVQVLHHPRLALEVARTMRPDVALIDIGLPEIDGYELAGLLRAESAGRWDLRLVALTGYGLDRDRERSVRAGFSDHLVKPVELATLQRLLAQPPSAAAPASDALRAPPRAP